MPAKDVYHDAVKNALIKDGWTITADPYKIKYKDAELFADLAVEKPIVAEQNGRKIVVEIKSFLSPSPMRDFELALGQYILYRNLINLTEPEYQISVDWVNQKRINNTHVHIRIKNEKIYIEEDWTEEGIANELLTEGVTKEDIVLAFHDPETRKLTEFAVV